MFSWLIAIVIIILGFTVNYWFFAGLILLWLIKLPRLLKKSRVMSILAQEYQYEFGATSTQAFTLNKIERESRKENWNEYELATVFMTVMVNSLFEIEELDEETKKFVLRTYDNARRLCSVHNKISNDIFSDLHLVTSQKLAL